jgi:hypothetical protein
MAAGVASCGHWHLDVANACEMRGRTHAEYHPA